MKDWRKLIPANWKVVLMSLVVNTIVIVLVIVITPGIELVNYQFGAGYVELIAISLALLNTFIKPILQLLTIRLLFVTYGLVLIVTNALVLYLLAFIIRDLEIDSVLSALFGGIIMGLSSSFLDYLFGVTPPLGYSQALSEEAS